MTDLTKIREAVEGIKKQYAIEEEQQVHDWLQTLLDTAEKVINAKMPEKIYRQNSQHLTSGDWWACNFCGAMGPCKCANLYNEAIDACRLAIVKDYVPRAEVEELVEALEDTKHILFLAKDEAIKEIESALAKWRG